MTAETKVEFSRIFIQLFFGGLGVYLGILIMEAWYDKKD